MSLRAQAVQPRTLAKRHESRDSGSRSTDGAVDPTFPRVSIPFIDADVARICKGSYCEELDARALVHTSRTGAE